MAIYKDNAKIVSVYKDGNAIANIYKDGDLVFTSSGITPANDVTITLVTTGLANATASIDTNPITEGGTAVITVSPNSGYHFDNASQVTISENDGDISLNNKVFNNGNVTVTVNAEDDLQPNSTATVTITGSAQQDIVAFACSDWTGTATSNSSGTVTVTNGNAASTQLFSENCPDRSKSCSGTSCNATVQVTVPSGYSNSGSTLTCTVFNINVPAGASNFSSSSDWVGSLSYTSGGTAVISSGNLTNVSVSPSSASANTSCDNGTVNATITGTVSDSTYCNNGSTVSFSYSASQNAGGDFLNPNPSITIAVDGTITLDADGLTGATTNPTSFASREQNCDSIQRCVTVTGTIPSQYCDAGSFSGQRCASQQGGQIDFPVNTWNGSVSVSSYGTVSFNAGSNLSGAEIISADNPCTTSSCPSVNSQCNTESYTRMFTIQADVPEDSDYCNAGDTITFKVGATQTGGATTYDAADFCSQGGVDANGNIDCPNGFTCTPIGFTEGTTVKEPTTRTVRISRTVPVGFCNSGDTVTHDCTYTQQASASNSLDVNTNNLQFDGTGGALTDDHFDVTVTPVGSYTVSDNRSWITTSQSGNTITVSVDDYSGGSNRTGAVTVQHTLDSSLTEVVTVTQFGEV